MQERYKLRREKSPVTFSAVPLQLSLGMQRTGCFLSSVFPAKSQAHVALHPCMQRQFLVCTWPWWTWLGTKWKAVATQTRFQIAPPGEPEEGRELQGDTRDWQVNPVYKNPSVRQGARYSAKLLIRFLSISLAGSSLSRKEQRSSKPRTWSFWNTRRKHLWEKWKKKSSVWAVIKTACFQGREILPLWAAAGGMRSVREHNSKVCQTLHQWETPGTTENSDSNFWGCNTAWEIGTPSPRQTTDPRGRACWSLHPSLSHTRHALFCCLAVPELWSCSKPLLFCLWIRANQQENPRLPSEVPAHNTEWKQVIQTSGLTSCQLEMNPWVWQLGISPCMRWRENAWGWEWLNEQRTRLGGTSGVTATLPPCRCHHVINTFILIIFLVSFWKSCHKWGGWKAKELKKILWPVMAQGTVSDKLSDKQTIKPYLCGQGWDSIWSMLVPGSLSLQGLWRKE